LGPGCLPTPPGGSSGLGAARLDAEPKPWLDRAVFDPPLVFHKSRRRDWFSIGSSVWLGWVFVQMAQETAPPVSIVPWAILAILVFVTMIELYGVLFTRSYLQVDTRGLTIRDRSREEFYAWSDIASFKVVDWWLGPLVCFDLLEKGRLEQPAPVATSRFGSDRTLMDRYSGVSAPVLAALLNQSLIQASAPTQAAHTAVPA
jgi:hypothetical protein